MSAILSRPQYVNSIMCEWWLHDYQAGSAMFIACMLFHCTLVICRDKLINNVFRLQKCPNLILSSELVGVSRFDACIHVPGGFLDCFHACMLPSSDYTSYRRSDRGPVLGGLHDSNMTRGLTHWSYCSLALSYRCMVIPARRHRRNNHSHVIRPWKTFKNLVLLATWPLIFAGNKWRIPRFHATKWTISLFHD